MNAAVVVVMDRDKDDYEDDANTMVVAFESTSSATSNSMTS